jgi:hypothetical protein
MATSAQDIPAMVPPCLAIIDRTIAVSSSTSSRDQGPMYVSPPSITDVVIVTHRAFSYCEEEAHHSVARSDVRDDFGIGPGSWPEIARFVWISRPTSDLVLGRL